MKTINKSVVISLLILYCSSIYGVEQNVIVHEIRVGYVDKDSLLMQMPEMHFVEDSIIKVRNSYMQLYQKYEQERAQKIDLLSKTKDSMSDNLLMLYAKEIEDLAEYMQYIQSIAQQDLTTLRFNLIAPIMQKINDAIKAVGEEYGFTYITDVRWNDYIPAISDKYPPILKTHYDKSPNLRNGEKLFIPTGENVTSLVKHKLQIP